MNWAYIIISFIVVIGVFALVYASGTDEDEED